MEKGVEQKTLVFIPVSGANYCLDYCISSIREAIPNVNVCIVGDSFRTIGHARTAMCEAANHLGEKYFCMIDSDILVPSNWLSESLKYMEAGVGAVFCKKLTNIKGLREFEEWCYRRERYPLVNSGRLDTACAVFRTEAVQGFKSNLESLEDLLLGEYIISKGFSHVCIDLAVKHEGYGGSIKGYYKALRKDGASLRKLHRASLLGLCASVFVMFFKAKRFKLFILRYRLMLLWGFLHE